MFAVPNNISFVAFFPTKTGKQRKSFLIPIPPPAHTHTAASLVWKQQPQELYGRCRRENSRLPMPYTTRVQLYTMSFYYPRPSTPATPHALVQFSILLRSPPSLLPPNSGVVLSPCLYCCWFNDKRMMLLEDTNNKDMPRMEGGTHALANMPGKTQQP